MNPQTRIPTDKELCHERLGEAFAEALSNYDTETRVSTLVDGFLTDEMVRGKTALDVGCGLGFFTQRLKERGARVIGCDIGTSLVETTHRRTGCPTERADALALVPQFGADRFDIVLSSECIEHTPDPAGAVRQMVGVLRPGGYLCLSTPNLVWYPVVRLATLLRARPFDGHENFSSWRGLRGLLKSLDVEVLREQGLHLFPFQLPLHPLSRWCDRRLQALRGCMINLCILGRKRQ